MPRIFYRTADGQSEFVEGHNPFLENMRHPALLVRDNTLLVFYSRIGDCPEHIVPVPIDISRDWQDWHPSKSISVLKPEHEYEGTHLPKVASVAGVAEVPKHELRDPAIYTEEGNNFLVYSIAGESGIAVAKLHFHF